MVKLVLSSIVQAFSCLVVVNIRLDLSPKKIPRVVAKLPHQADISGHSIYRHQDEASWVARCPHRCPIAAVHTFKFGKGESIRQ